MKEKINLNQFIEVRGFKICKKCKKTMKSTKDHRCNKSIMRIRPIHPKTLQAYGIIPRK